MESWDVIQDISWKFVEFFRHDADDGSAYDDDGSAYDDGGMSQSII